MRYIFVLKIVVGALLLAIVLRKIELGSVKVMLLAADPWLIALSTVALAGGIALNGNEAGTVTELEERATKKKLSDINAKRLAERQLSEPITVVRQQHSPGSIKTTTGLITGISESQLKKID